MPLIFRVESFDHVGPWAAGGVGYLGGWHPFYSGPIEWSYNTRWGFASLEQLFKYFPYAASFAKDHDRPLYCAVYDCTQIKVDDTQAIFDERDGIFIMRIELADLAIFAPQPKKPEIIVVDDFWFEAKERPRSFGLWGNWYESGVSFGRLSSSRELQQAPKPVGDWMLEIEPREKYKGRAWQANQPGDQPWKGQRP